MAALLKQAAQALRGTISECNLLRSRASAFARTVYTRSEVQEVCRSAAHLGDPPTSGACRLPFASSTLRRSVWLFRKGIAMDSFDPYQQWLGISRREQPPNRYRLIGVGVFEFDPEVIRESADRQI